MFTAIKNGCIGCSENRGKTVQPVKTKKKLSRADKKQIEAAIARANRTDKKGKSAQDSIPYERMWPDGICRVSDSHYTKTIQFQDINYQLSQTKIRRQSLRGGVISSIILTARFIFSCLFEPCGIGGDLC